MPLVMPPRPPSATTPSHTTSGTASPAARTSSFSAMVPPLTSSNSSLMVGCSGSKTFGVCCLNHFTCPSVPARTRARTVTGVLESVSASPPPPPPVAPPGAQPARTP